MSAADRGILYIVWGEKAQAALDRSIRSVRTYYQDLPIHVERVAESEARLGLRHKSRMGSLTPFRTTLYLDADTLVLGGLEYAFEKAERFGLACALCECPWLRRYGADAGDSLEYNTGVLFFTEKAQGVFRAWEEVAATTASRARWLDIDGRLRQGPYDDQASFARAIEQCNFNPFVLPINFNFRPQFFPRFFTPIKIWHDYRDPPAQLAELSLASESGQSLVRALELSIEIAREEAGPT